MSADEFSQWEAKLGVRRTAMLFCTLWMTWEAFAWARSYASSVPTHDGLAVAAIIAAVTAPISYLQVAVFKAYLESKP